ncbi:MAG: 23S rRNA (uracil(1939)-C(5))-methyltransferase RlmD, partial [Butyrivibrio sp.]|nr:23S rRNA (uracil(1939)-C(5))-methyltransferase RlmD [Butyrivibrio sp.]
VDFYAKDASEFMVELAQEGGKVDVVFMDPPRSGSTPVFLSSLFKLAPQKVVYISCSPDSLAVDLEMLTSNGYKITKAVPVDMFPYTRSIETVVCLSRAKK